MLERIKALQKAIREREAQAYWCLQGANRRYLCGFTGSNGWLLVPARGQALLLTDGRYTEQARQECPAIAIMVRTEPLHKTMAAWLMEKGIKRLVVEDEDVSLSTWAKLKKAAPGLKAMPSQGLVETSRRIKSAPEIRYLKKAITIAQKAYHQLLPKLKAGLKETEVAHLLEVAMLDAGGQGIAFPTIVASGVHGAMPHAQPTAKRLKAGELVVLDFGCLYEGYHSDLTRTVAIARMTAKQQEIYKIVKKAQLSAQKLLLSGQFVAESDKRARNVFKAAHLEQYFVHSLGHGLGLEIHEAPRLSITAREQLRPGMVVTCEPGLYLPGWGGIRIEDDLLITAREAQWLSHSPHELPVVSQPS